VLRSGVSFFFSDPLGEAGAKKERASNLNPLPNQIRDRRKFRRAVQKTASNNAKSRNEWWEIFGITLWEKPCKARAMPETIGEHLKETRELPHFHSAVSVLKSESRIWLHFAVRPLSHYGMY